MRNLMRMVPFLKFINLTNAKAACVEETTQGQEHIKPLHRHFAMRLVLEGGFFPDDITPHPPFEFKKIAGRNQLSFNEVLGSNSEQTVFGGVKTKQIDVVVTKRNVGPVIAISFKATQNAFRNLTNRMEEAVGDCTNLHLRYPSLVYGFYHVLLANRLSQVGEHRLVRSKQDVSIDETGNILPQVMRYCKAIEALSDRKSQFDEPSAYEAVAIDFVESAPTIIGQSFEPAVDTIDSVHRDSFLQKLLEIYDFRYPFMGESIAGMERVEWDENSPLFDTIKEQTGADDLETAIGYIPRIAS
jgi:hypothetical protein